MFLQIHFHPHTNQNLIHYAYQVSIGFVHKTHVHYGNPPQLLYFTLNNYFHTSAHFFSFNEVFALFLFSILQQGIPDLNIFFQSHHRSFH